MNRSLETVLSYSFTGILTNSSLMLLNRTAHLIQRVLATKAPSSIHFSPGAPSLHRRFSLIPCPTVLRSHQITLCLAPKLVTIVTRQPWRQSLPLATTAEPTPNKFWGFLVTNICGKNGPRIGLMSEPVGRCSQETGLHHPALQETLGNLLGLLTPAACTR